MRVRRTRSTQNRSSLFLLFSLCFHIQIQIRIRSFTLSWNLFHFCISLSVYKVLYLAYIMVDYLISLTNLLRTFFYSFHFISVIIESHTLLGCFGQLLKILFFHSHTHCISLYVSLSLSVCLFYLDYYREFSACVRTRMLGRNAHLLILKRERKLYA